MKNKSVKQNCKHVTSQVLGRKGWRSDESTRLPPMWPASNPGVEAICGLSLLLVLSFAPRDFSPGTPVFPSPQKPTFPNSNSTRNQVDEEPLCGCAISKSLFIYLFIYLFMYLFIYLFIYYSFVAENFAGSKNGEMNAL